MGQSVSVQRAGAQLVGLLDQRAYLLLAFAAQLQYVAAVFIHLAAGTSQSLLHLFAGAGLEQILLYAVFHSLPGIIKVIVARQDNGVQMWMQRAGTLDQLQAVHAGHAHVRHQDIGHVIHHAVQRSKGVGAAGRYDNVQTIPIHHFYNAVTDDCFVIHQQQLIHGYSSLFTEARRSLGR